MKTSSHGFTNCVRDQLEAMRREQNLRGYSLANRGFDRPSQFKEEIHMRALITAFCCLFLIVSSAWAQSDRGTITGTVTDPAGAMIPNAAIEAKNVNTGAVFQAASSATGNYSLVQLPAG
ncbi:MAG TPA: carboxypeptidase-like regulatory domain-containing protein, partial [Acidobacteriota bacterium]|nr:carboxypeptidase-like regulatory domain-containing protein [Acidobacteriota bacterium]